MQGFQLTFFTQQDRTYDNKSVAQWVIDEALALGVKGMTLNASVEGVGHDGRTHIVNMFDLSEQPIQVTMVVKPDLCEQLLQHFENRGLNLFYTKKEVVFGYL